MSQPELLDQIRSSRIAASPELRMRVQTLAAVAPPAEPPRREWPWRRAALVLVPACAALALTGALVAGLATSGKSGQKKTAVHGAAVQREKAATPPPVVFSTATVPQDSAATLAPLNSSTGAAGGAGNSGALPATPGRAQLYEAEVTLKVKDLSAATKRALRLTSTFHGYVRSVEYGSGTERGTANLVVRVPVGSVQEAIVRFSAIGTILDQHVSIRDVQPQLDLRFRRMQALRDSIAKLQAKLESPTLSAADRAALENKLVAARRQLVVLQREQTRQQRQVSFATVSMNLRTTGAAAAPSHEPGRIGRALHRSGSILLGEAQVLVYVLLVGSPLLAVALLGLGASRVRRRRTEARLLST